MPTGIDFGRMRWRRTIGVIAALIVLAAGLACGGGPAAVRMGTEAAYPPFTFINDGGEIDGFERVLGDELCRRAELECVWKVNEWESIIPNLVAGEYDTITAGMSITAQRDALIHFTQPYFPPTPSVHVALAGAGDDVVPGRVAAQVGTIQADDIVGSGATLLEFDLAEGAVAAVLRGAADAALADKAYLKDLVAKSGGRLIFVGAEVRFGVGVGIGVREEDWELRRKLDGSIGAMKEDGSLNALIREWFGDDAETF